MWSKELTSNMQRPTSLLILLPVFSYAMIIQPIYRPEDVVDTSVPDEAVSLTDEDFSAIDNGFKEQNLSTILSPEQQSKLTDGDPTLRANKLEGDINMPWLQPIKTGIAGTQVLRSAVSRSHNLWPNREVPYLISSRYGKYARRVIAMAMRKYHEQSCIRFVPRKDQKDYIYIHADDGCYSVVGRVGGRQTVSLDEGCIQTGTIVHELLHALGFFHEQSRSDRDDYVRVVKENILAGAEDQFLKYSLRSMRDMGVGYDYGSIMHYGPYAFSKHPYSVGPLDHPPVNERCKKSPVNEGLTAKDLKKLNILYECSVEDIQANRKKPDNTLGTLIDRGNTISASCRDKDWLCSAKILFWSCRDRDVADGCEKKCGYCTKGQPVTPISVSPKCEDKREGDKCKLWKDHGRCQSHPTYMNFQCRKTCTGCE